MENRKFSENAMKKTIQITEQNQILLSNNGAEEQLDFNTLYKGYYPDCVWTKAVVCDDTFFLAGTDTSGIPFLFSSLSGKVWTEVNIRTRLPVITPKEYGEIKEILYDDGTRQMYLVTENGILVTLPDCPKCVRARKVMDTKAVGAKITDGKICIDSEDGSHKEIPVDIAAEYRCAQSFAKEVLKTGGFVIDLRSEDEQKTTMSAIRGLFPIEKVFPFPAENIEMLFEKLPKDTPLFFLCEYGYKADEAARLGRRSGFSQAYSLGGIEDVVE